MEMGLLRQTDNLILEERRPNMTKAQKLILIVLTINAVLLGFGLMCSFMQRTILYYTSSIAFCQEFF